MTEEKATTPAKPAPVKPTPKPTPKPAAKQPVKEEAKEPAKPNGIGRQATWSEILNVQRGLNLDGSPKVKGK